MPVAKKSQSGFSLIELLVAVVILAVGLLGLAQLQVTAIKANSQSATSSAATALAQMVVEGVAAMGADDPIFNGPSTNNTWSGSPVTVAGGGTYNITYDVEQVESESGKPVTNLYRVVIEVESTGDLMHVLGNQERKVMTTTLKRAI